MHTQAVWDDVRRRLPAGVGNTIGPPRHDRDTYDYTMLGLGCVDRHSLSQNRAAPAHVRVIQRLEAARRAMTDATGQMHYPEPKPGPAKPPISASYLHSPADLLAASAAAPLGGGFNRQARMEALAQVHAERSQAAAQRRHQLEEDARAVAVHRAHRHEALAAAKDAGRRAAGWMVVLAIVSRAQRWHARVQQEREVRSHVRMMEATALRIATWAKKQILFKQARALERAGQRMRSVIHGWVVRAKFKRRRAAGEVLRAFFAQGLMISPRIFALRQIRSTHRACTVIQHWWKWFALALRARELAALRQWDAVEQELLVEQGDTIAKRERAERRAGKASLFQNQLVDRPPGALPVGERVPIRLARAVIRRDIATRRRAYRAELAVHQRVVDAMAPWLAKQRRTLEREQRIAWRGNPAAFVFNTEALLAYLPQPPLFPRAVLPRAEMRAIVLHTHLNAAAITAALSPG